MQLNDTLFQIGLLAWLAGGTAVVGGGIAACFKKRDSEIEQEWVHGIMAFGGGILLAAVAFALAPPAMERLSVWSIVVSFSGGGLLVLFLDAAISRSGGSKAQLMAMLLDFVPEAVAFGAVFAQDATAGFLLAGFIGAQNLPEGFNAFLEIKASGKNAKHILSSLLAVTLLGPIAGCAGYMFLQDQPRVTAVMMSAASGGILYLVFQDIAPGAVMKRHWAPPLGAVAGFVTGMAGHMLLS